METQASAKKMVPTMMTTKMMRLKMKNQSLEMMMEKLKMMISKAAKRLKLTSND
jgi:hypothetical protein